MSVVEYEVGRQPGLPTRKRVEVDPITLRVLGGAFHAIAKEMAGVLFRMSYSSIIRESEDLGAGIFDAEGRELCESDSTPMHIGSLPWYIRGFLWRLEDEIEEGDVIVHNHPYLGASHSPDVAVAVPIFHDGELLGFAAVTAHVLDVGGSFPGINADAFDVYAEAKVYNALRWYKRGELPTEWEEIVFAMEPNETRGPVQGPRGLHVFQLVENKTETVRPFAEVKDSLREQLYQEEMEKQTKVWLQELRKKAHIDVKL